MDQASDKESLEWYVIRAISGQEKKVKTHLENEINRCGYTQTVPQILIPLQKVYEVRNGKKRMKERNFFPGYIMVQANLSDPEVAHTLNKVPGVIGFLSSKEKMPRLPVPLRKQEVNRILGKMDEMEEDAERMDTMFIMGEAVKVMDGPFSGFVGTVDEISEEKRRLRVMVKIFGRNTPIELKFFQVEKQA